MAEGTIIGPMGVRIGRLATSSTTSDVLKFSGNSERHIIFSISPTVAYEGAWFVITNSSGQSGYKEIVNATGMTLSLGSRQLTFAHNSASITYLDIVVTGSIVSI